MESSKTHDPRVNYNIPETYILTDAKKKELEKYGFVISHVWYNQFETRGYVEDENVLKTIALKYNVDIKDAVPVTFRIDIFPPKKCDDVLIQLTELNIEIYPINNESYLVKIKEIENIQYPIPIRANAYKGAHSTALQVALIVRSRVDLLLHE